MKREALHPSQGLYKGVAVFLTLLIKFIIIHLLWLYYFDDTFICAIKFIQRNILSPYIGYILLLNNKYINLFSKNK